MVFDKRKEEWERVVFEMQGVHMGICVKRSDVDVFKEPMSTAIIAFPFTPNGCARDDNALFAHIKKNSQDGNVILVGHGWFEKEMFTVMLTVDEFIQHWKGD